VKRSSSRAQWNAGDKVALAHPKRKRGRFAEWARAETWCRQPVPGASSSSGSSRWIAASEPSVRIASNRDARVAHGQKVKDAVFRGQSPKWEIRRSPFRDSSPSKRRVSNYLVWGVTRNSVNHQHRAYQQGCGDRMSSSTRERASWLRFKCSVFAPQPVGPVTPFSWRDRMTSVWVALRSRVHTVRAFRSKQLP
jgi:hypothetical protein